MKVEEKKWIRFRIYVIAGFFILGFGIIFARAYQLQVIEKDYLRGTAENGIIGSAELPPDRGIIYDRQGTELALNVQVASIFVHPRQVEDKKRAAHHLSKILDEKESVILKFLSSDRPFEWIRRKVPPELGRQVADLKIEGIGVTTETKRYYPARETGAHLIGFAGLDNQGLEGLEKQYDAPLKGSPKKLIWRRDALGRPFAIHLPESSGRGMHHLILTIDKDIQYKAQEVLDAAVAKSKALGGQCLVLDPETGEILAMAVSPGFNPNSFAKAKPEQWRNRVLTDLFEPGSTMKPFVVASALEEGVVTPLTEFYCENGKFAVGGRTVHDVHKYGTLSVADILIHSSNIGAIKIGTRLGYSRFVDYLKRFGFSRKTGIDIPGEREGFVRSPKNARPIDQATVYFGQGVTNTSLQLAMAMGVIANGGHLMRPFVVKKIIDESGRVVEETRPQVIRRVISTHTANTVAHILEGVASDQGTAKGAAIPGYRVAGKTGTSQKVDPLTRQYSKSKYVATFVGFVPSDRARLLISVSIDEPKGVVYGGLVAGPVFKELGSWALNHLGINPQTETLMANVAVPPGAGRGVAQSLPRGPLSPEVREVVEQLMEGLVPDFTGMGMRDVLRKGRALGLKVSLEGSGLAVAQEPEPGSPLGSVSTVKVSFHPPGSS